MSAGRLARIVALAACALPAAGALAASTGTLSDRDDSAGAADLSRVRVVHNRVSDELVWSISLHDPLDPAALAGGDGRPPGSVCANVWTRSRPGEGGPDYEVCATPDARGRLRASVARHFSSGRVRRVARAKVEQPAPDRLVLRADPDAVRRPRALRWTLQTVSFGSGCPAATGCEDYVPDRPGSARLELRTPRSR